MNVCVTIMRAHERRHISTEMHFMILTFRGPCIMIYSYNKSQWDALFLKFILMKNSTCFGQIYCPSSGVSTLYTAIGIFHASYVGCLLADNQHNQHDKYLVLCIKCWDSWWWTVDLSETCRVIYQNKLEKQCISLAFIIRAFHDINSFSRDRTVSHKAHFGW
jgi:hypothetical protein